MKKLLAISLTLFICCSAFSDDEDEDLIPTNREIIRSICIGVLHGGACFGVTLLLSLPVGILFPELFSLEPFSPESFSPESLSPESFPERPYVGYRGADISELGLLILAAAQEEAFYRIVLQPVVRSFICNRLNQISNNNQRNHLIARHSANLLCSICFGAAHLYNPLPSLFQTLDATLGGYALGELSYRYGRIAVITSHITHNFLVFLIRASLLYAEK